MPNTKRPLSVAWFRRFPNFGDALNPWLLERITGRRVESFDILSPPETPYLVAIGSILHFATNHAQVWGSGLMTANDPLKGPPSAIHAVRGPLTQEALRKRGIPAPTVLGDPALLVPRFYDPWVFHKTDWGMVPHFTDRNHPWIQHCRELRARVIDVFAPVQTVLRQIKACRRILSSSLHGLIVAEAYGIPTRWITLGDKVVGGGFKFRDHYAALGRPDESPYPINPDTLPTSVLETATRKPVPMDLDVLVDALPDL